MAGEGVEVTGAGTQTAPYVISSGGIDVSDAIQFIDTASVDFTVTGSGTDANPYRISAVAQLAVEDLTDVTCASPANGQTLLWNGTSWACGKPSYTLASLTDVTCSSPDANDVLTWDGTGWVCAPVSVEAGAIHTEAPVIGDGTVAEPIGLDLQTDHGASGSGTAADPVIVNTAEEYGSGVLDHHPEDSTFGTPVYVDSAGDLRTPNQTDLLRILYPDWAAAGITLGAGVTIRSTTDSYIAFQRFGPQLTVYVNGVNFTPSGGEVTGDVTNAEILSLPESLRPAWGAILQAGSTGRMATYAVSRDTMAIYLTSAIPNANNVPGDAWASLVLTISGQWFLDPEIDPNHALDDLWQYHTDPPVPFDFLADTGA